MSTTADTNEEKQLNDPELTICSSKPSTATVEETKGYVNNSHTIFELSFSSDIKADIQQKLKDGFDKEIYLMHIKNIFATTVESFIFVTSLLMQLRSTTYTTKY
jgi:hypothetical protein